MKNRKSKKAKLEGVSAEYECTAKNNVTSQCSGKKYKVMELASSCRVEPASKSMAVTPSAALATEPNVLVGDEEDGFEPVIQDICDDLEARIEELKNETSMCSRELMKFSELCAQLTEKNNCLLDKLKKTCTSDVISKLEARDPVRSQQSVDDESRFRCPESQSDLNFSPDHSLEIPNLH